MDDSSESQLVGMVEKEVKEIMLKKKNKMEKIRQDCSNGQQTRIFEFHNAGFKHFLSIEQDDF
jgi:hypothetical protein